VNDNNITTKFFSGLQWLLLIAAVALPAGTAVAFFLWLLERVTILRWQNEWLLLLLPAGGVVIQLLYSKWGRKAAGGNNLVLEEIHQPGGGVPLVMAPLVLFTSAITHLLGGSAGREGTAVQIGGSIAGALSSKLKLPAGRHRILLMTGIAAGFGAVFGTPVAGAIFALEVPYGGKIKTDGWLQCLLAAYAGHLVCSAWGIQHTHYHMGSLPAVTIGLQVRLLFFIVLAAVFLGWVARLFGWLTHTIATKSSALMGEGSYLIPIAGGLVIVALSFLPGGNDYLGLGVSAQHAGGVSIIAAFASAGVVPWAWLLKLVFTAVTLGTGFKGGEVTPLFFIGATLGSAFAIYTGMPVGLFAAIGFIAVFAAAANTPLACVVMGVELFGAEPVVYFAIACGIAWLSSGHTGIYHSQRIGIAKRRNAGVQGMTIQEARQRRRNSRRN
jgi:H+/Cl- antiporter ClcA